MLERAARLESRRPDLQERVVFLAPAELREIEQHPAFFNFVRQVGPAQPSTPVGAIKDELIHTLRMPGRVFDGDWSALAGGQHRKTLGRLRPRRHIQSRESDLNERSPASRSESPQPRES